MMASTLPTDDANLQAQPASRPGRKGTLLIVDDEDGARQSLRVIFKDDYDILLAADGPTAIQLAASHDIDVAVLDIRMAGMSGIEVLERFKYVNPSIQAVVMTAYETNDTLRQALRLRACDYINKPFDVSTMRAAVAAAMQRHGLHDETHAHKERLPRLLEELESQRIEGRMATTRSEIYSSIVHDINGPLTVISGLVPLLNERVGNADRLEAEDLQFVKDQLRTMARSVANCIDISRRYLSLLRRQCDDTPRVGVNQLLADLGRQVALHPSLEDNRFAIRPLAEDIRVRMNGTDVIQVLLNLVVNGLQCASRPHSVGVQGCILSQALDLGAFKDSPRDRLLNVEGFDNTPPLLMISVCDDGPGIAPDVLPKIFEAYFSTKAARQGTGLGLNIVQRLIKEAQGALHVHTQVGQGTTFSVYLPAMPLISS